MLASKIVCADRVLASETPFGTILEAARLWDDGLGQVYILTRKIDDLAFGMHKTPHNKREPGGGTVTVFCQNDVTLLKILFPSSFKNDGLS